MRKSRDSFLKCVLLRMVNQMPRTKCPKIEFVRQIECLFSESFCAVLNMCLIKFFFLI